jgi:hypothetical protein
MISKISSCEIVLLENEDLLLSWLDRDVTSLPELSPIGFVVRKAGWTELWSELEACDANDRRAVVMLEMTRAGLIGWGGIGASSPRICRNLLLGICTDSRGRHDLSVFGVDAEVASDLRLGFVSISQRATPSRQTPILLSDASGDPEGLVLNGSFLPMACKISSFGETAMAISKADIERAALRDGTACKTVPSWFLDDCLSLLNQEFFFRLVGDAVFFVPRLRSAMASCIDEVLVKGVDVPRLENMDTLLLHSSSNWHEERSCGWWSIVRLTKDDTWWVR